MRDGSFTNYLPAAHLQVIHKPKKINNL
jgi:hypothetical protein